MKRMSVSAVCDLVSDLADQTEITQCSEEFGRLLSTVRGLDARLATELDAAVGAYVAAYMEAYFAAGWEAARQPELIVFGE